MEPYVCQRCQAPILPTGSLATSTGTGWVHGFDEDCGTIAEVLRRLADRPSQNMPFSMLPDRGQD